MRGSDGYLTNRHEVEFTVRGDKGLQVQFPEELSQASKNVLERHDKTVEKTCGLLGARIDGRALFLAVITNADMWKAENLQLL